jgi:hypothetical protein
MEFDAKAYGAAVAAILAMEENGQRLMPLAGGRCTSPEALAALQSASARQLFPESRAPEAALAGLYLYFSCWNEAHEVAQGISSPEGSYWHAIIHRQEPDAGNSSYWFRRVGAHPIFPALRERAAQIGVSVGAKWDPFAFIDMCERARQSPGSEEERKCLEVQRAEWQLLFGYCAAKAARA